jgi:DNA-binding MarR family transcriptional regulator
MGENDNEKWVGTVQMAALVGLSPDFVRLLARSGAIPSRRTEQGHYQLHIATRDSIRDNNKTNRPNRTRKSLPVSGYKALDLLNSWGRSTANELAEVIGIHPGNVRKALAIAHTRGWTSRVDNQNWEITDQGREQLNPEQAVAAA